MNKITLLLATLLALPAYAEVNLARCDDDGETEVPTFGTRPGGGADCLYVDPGNGEAPVPFQYEFFHQPAEAGATLQCGNGTPNPINHKITDDGCPDKESVGCNLLLWDLFIDNYSHADCKNVDILEFGYGHKTMWIKDSVLANTVACKGDGGNGSPGWNGPNGLSCAPNEHSGHHTDGIQSKGFPNHGGWFVIQDTILVNGFNEHTLFQKNPTYGAAGSLSIQGGTYGRLASIGQATNWIEDCKDRQGSSETSDICPVGQSNWGYPFAEVWMIDVHSPANTLGNCNPAHRKCITVNTGCSAASGCGGSIGYTNGWAHPLNHPGTGPGTCPNSQIATGPNMYCYTSLEAAAEDHTLPPFAQFSCAGWADPPETCTGGGGGGGGDDVSILTAVTSPVTAGDAHTLSATVSNNDGTTTVTWDCDGDLAFDDGTPDTSVPFSQVCSAISTPGSYTVGARVVDDNGNDDDDALLIVSPECGNDTTEAPEVCDGTDLNSLDCTDPLFGTFTGGTLACDVDCGGYDVAGCTGGTPSACDDGFCDRFGGETDVSCFEDCALSIYSVTGQFIDGFNYFVSPLATGATHRIDRALVVDQAVNVAAEPYTTAISAYRFVWDSDDDSPYSLLQNSAAYTMCGDTGPNITDSIPCDPPPPVGTHTLAITPCNQNFSGTFNVPPYTDARCTSGGGKLGPTETFTLIVKYRQVSKFMDRAISRGLGFAITNLAMGK